MKKSILLIPIVLLSSGCTIFSAYSLNSRNADDVKSEVRKGIVDESISRCKEYVDATCEKKK